MLNTPANILDKSDPGDDVVRRFRYQHSYAAINAIRLILPNTNVALVICENHEDCLVQLIDGSFIGIQVKTRDLPQDTFKAIDSVVVKAFAKFAKLDAKFPSSFRSFEFVTNTYFWTDKEDHRNLPWILSEIRARSGIKGLRSTNPLRQFADSVAAEAGLNVHLVAQSICKVKIKSLENTLNSIGKDVETALRECPGVGLLPYDTVCRIAKSVVELVADASTKQLKGPVSDIYQAGIELSALLDEQELANKCIDGSNIHSVIDDHKSAISTFEEVNIAELNAADDLPRDLARMIVKMARGGVEYERVTHVENLVRSLQALYLKWVSKYGPAVATAHYNTVLSTVLMECTEANITARASGDPFGSRMYSILYEKLKSRVSDSPDQFFGCRPEHLLGAAGVLTEACKTWWSDHFDLSGGES